MARPIPPLDEAEDKLARATRAWARVDGEENAKEEPEKWKALTEAATVYEKSRVKNRGK